MKQKKIPLRMCLGCQEMKPKKELLRIVKDKEGPAIVDITGKKAGRGAYICKNIKCFENAKKRKKIERAFESQIDAAVYDSLLEYMEVDNG